ncbi:MAG TPA: FAD-binding oxidoreductase [Flexivirga sp.]|uniref:NAD(P)/FAD-dependent oxidoreductase n=1 Tax=Flexivirga sp. TaxID=1962927 RepID=UPI002CB56A0A|nr:FAD-binding oxidoreductase [Flexivirga sp.]HWC20917.1 FAD-binding oxidoreductase [Flexivirga sp.]
MTSIDTRLARAKRAPFWLDTPARPPARPSLEGDTSCELAVVGGGFSGLWTAVLAKEANPDRDVLLLEGGRLAWAASGRNGGFCAASLTHGYDNGVSRFGEEAQAELDRLGMANLDQIEETVARYGIDCDFERTGEVDVATEAYQVAGEAPPGSVLLDGQAVRAELNSPTFLGGVWDKRGVAMLDPAKLAWGLADVAERLGVRIVEQSPVRELRKHGDSIGLRTDRGSVRAERVALATNVFPSLLRRLRLHCVPVYDHVLMTEPLSQEQLAAIGWQHRQGFGDSGNQFHYYRLTADNRILWGGYDAVYHYGRQLKAEYDDRPETFRKLAEHFDATFPQLAGIGFSHRWGGAIDTCTRFCAFFGAAYDHRVAYALGYTGLGVGASRFGAQVMLDLLDGADTERTRTPLVRSKPLPFPPEPLAFIGIEATRRSMAHADEHEGRRNLWLRGLDRVGLGFDS